MKKMTVVLGLVAMMSVSAFGVGFIGTPTAELEKSQWNVGFNYTYISMDLAKIKYSESSQEFDPAGNPDGDPETDSYKEEINDNNVQRYYGTIGYGVTDVWEAYVQLGIADVKAQTKEEGEESEGHNFDNDFAWGWGTRYTFYEQDNIRWGASLQMNWLDTSVGHKGTWVDGGLDGTWNATIDYETYDLLIAVGPTADMGGWNLYGGPFYYYLSGEIDGEVTITPSGWDTAAEIEKFSGDLEADSNFGGFVGAQISLKENCDLTTELSFTGDGMAIGAGVTWAF